jgi:hypothetical protein
VQIAVLVRQLLFGRELSAVVRVFPLAELGVEYLTPIFDDEVERLQQPPEPSPGASSISPLPLADPSSSPSELNH